MPDRPFQQVQLIAGYFASGATTGIGLAQLLGYIQTGLGIVSLILGLAIGWVTLQNQLHIRRQQKQTEV